MKFKDEKLKVGVIVLAFCLMVNLFFTELNTRHKLQVDNELYLAKLIQSDQSIANLHENIAGLNAELIKKDHEIYLSSEVINMLENMQRYELYNIPLTISDQIMIQEKCKEFGFDFQWYLAMLRQESNYKNIVGNENNNGTRDYGIAQLNEKYHEWQAKLAGLDSYNVMSIEDNVTMSLAQLRWIGETYKLTGIHAIYVYNVGSPTGDLNSEHTKKVTRYYNELNKMRINVEN